jgi:SP family xylose:H+ symportor-like MFS transporter
VNVHGPVERSSDTPSVPLERSTYVWGISIVAALGGFLFGYDWVVIGGARQFYEVYFHLSSAALIGWANSCALLGCLLGSLAAGYCADRFGRRYLLIFAGVLFAMSSACTGWSFTFHQFIFWRIAGGVAIGLTSNVSPLYIAEVSPAAIRGRLISLNQFAIVVGILLAQVINWTIARPVPSDIRPLALAQSWNVQQGWRLMFFAVVAPALIFTVASLFLPESPRWLALHHSDAEASRVLTRIGGEVYAAAEIANIERAVTSEQAQRPAWSDLLRPGVRRLVVLGVLLAVLQQWTGINIIFNYAADIYRSVGYGTNGIFLNIVITGAINLLFTIVAMFLVDTLGRRVLMLLGCGGIAAADLLCALAYSHHWHAGVFLVLTLAAIACYAFTLAPVTWVLIAEIFPNRLRSHGVSVSVSALWIASFLLTYTFPTLDRLLSTGGVFLGYGVICIAGGTMVFFWIPETAGRSLESIESMSLVVPGPKPRPVKVARSPDRSR